MEKVNIELSKFEIQMLLNCIESALDTKHVPEVSEKRVEEIKKEFSKYLQD